MGTPNKKGAPSDPTISEEEILDCSFGRVINTPSLNN